MRMKIITCWCHPHASSVTSLKNTTSKTNRWWRATSLCAHFLAIKFYFTPHRRPTVITHLVFIKICLYIHTHILNDEKQVTSAKNVRSKSCPKLGTGSFLDTYIPTQFFVGWKRNIQATTKQKGRRRSVAWLNGRVPSSQSESYSRVCGRCSVTSGHVERCRQRENSHRSSTSSRRRGKLTIWPYMRVWRSGARWWKRVIPAASRWFVRWIFFRARERRRRWRVRCVNMKWRHKYGGRPWYSLNSFAYISIWSTSQTQLVRKWSKQNWWRPWSSDAPWVRGPWPSSWPQLSP